MTPAARLVALLQEKAMTIATAESCTAGLISAAITDIPGSSAVFETGFVTYSNVAKQKLLNVANAELENSGAVSEPVAVSMAQGAKAAALADIAVAVSGIAGPGGSEHKPEGRVCFAVAGEGNTISETVEFGAIGRSEVRAAATDHALHLLLNYLHKA